jgi:MoxR-like ATPase
VKSLAHAVLAHRLVLRTDAELRDLTPADAVENVLASVETPSAPTSTPKNAE